MKALCSNVVFQVSDMERSLVFYTDVMGFSEDFTYGEPRCYAGLSMGPASIHITTNHCYGDDVGHGHFYIICDEVDEYYKDLVEKGVTVNGPLGDQDYGLRDFNIADPDGNKIGFGASIVDQ